MERYVPPYHITDQMLNLVAQIAEKAERVSHFRMLETKPYLRRNNRIRSIHSSLAIEANSLSLDEVRSVINGKTVIGIEKEIQEVKNAYRAYDMLGAFDPYNLDDLRKLHGEMTYLTVQESGVFRSHNEGVFNGDKCVFMAPPPQFVPDLMEVLFSWMNESRGKVHPLILSSVFHYEFVFIHPFADGNGRMARLWQTALLSEWNPIFRFLPLESHIHEFQSDYYSAISACNTNGNSDVFILFMLDKIDLTLDKALRQLAGNDAYELQAVRRLIDVMEYERPYTCAELMGLMKLKSRDNFRKLYLLPALKQGIICMSVPDKATSRNQTYIKK